ncbi:peritrophin-1-like [Penaeus japonicus]|uniref:peritrophin-1-like n=1 Tax=Penaeus japonicus TaxID=27405 RepID=UPI001C710AF3|nr:peritrophin-1-like [Penaeus japonicus]
MASVLFCVATLLAYTAPIYASSSCSPTCPAEPPDNTGVFVPDPFDCQRYYVCLQDGRPSDFPFECEDGQLFDSVNATCTDEMDATCGLCQPTCSLYACPVPSDGFVLAADVSDCGKYYVCGVSPDPLPAECPTDTPFFNGVECVDDESECCDPCLVYCSEAFTQIPNPADCTSYYFCLDVGFPGPDDLHRCEEGNFNATTSHCDRDASCQQISRCAA